MRIVAHLGVLDEAEMITQAVNHLYQIGVDHVIAFDMGSRDDTLEILEGYRGADLTLENFSRSTPWEELHARTVDSIQQTNADWALLLDADEFWLPATGSVRDCLTGAGSDVAIVDRFNVVLTDEGPAMPELLSPQNYDHVYLYTRRVEGFRQHLESHPETPWISGVPVPKVIARPRFISSIVMGGHDVRPGLERSDHRIRATDVLIAHLPFSTFDRFQKRTANIAEFFDLNPHYFRGSQGWHWRRLFEVLRRGEMREEFARQVVERERLEDLIHDGSVQTASAVLGLEASL